MSYNGSGTFLINSAGQPVVPGTTITTTAFNALTADLASGLTTAMTKDGQTVPTANIPMGGFKLTGLGAGTSATDAAQFGQLQNAPVATLITVSGADTITGTLVQTLTAYATGQQFSFVAAGTNTTAVTLNIDGLGAKAVTRTGAVALAAGALVSGQMAIVEYDGTRFQLINANAFTNLTVSGALTVGTTLAVTGVATLTAQPILSSLTASLPVFSDASKGLVSNAMTGTGSVMMSASPTTTGTLTAAAINASGLVAMAGAATVGTTLGVTGDITGSGTNGFKTGADNRGLYFNGSRNAVLGSNAADTVTIAAANANVAVFGAASTSLTGTLGVTGASTFNALAKFDIGNVTGTLGQNSQSNIHLGNAGAAIGNLVQIAMGYQATNTNSPAAIGFVATSAAGNTKGDLIFGTRDVTTDTAPTERMRITSAGVVELNGAGANGLFAILGRSGLDSMYVQRSNTAQSFGVGDDGNIYAGQIGASTGTALILSGGYIKTLTSSRRYKKDEEPIDIGLDFINTLKPIKFRLKENDLPQVGFIAEDFPDERLVDMSYIDIENKELGMRPESVHYSQITAPLVKAVQELSAKVAALEAAR